MEVDTEHLYQHFESLVKKLGQLLYDNKKEHITLSFLLQEIEDRRMDISEFKKKQEGFSLVERELEMIKNIVSEEEALFLLRKKEERENIILVSQEKEVELERKKGGVKDIEGEIREIQIRIEENQLKKQALEKKIELKGEKIETILNDIEQENKVLKELNEAVLQRVEDVDIIKKHEELVVARDTRLKELGKLTEMKTSMKEKIEMIERSLAKIDADLKEARFSKERKIEELKAMRQKHEDMNGIVSNLQYELSELETLDSEITFINYYISKAELKLMEYKRDHRNRQVNASKANKLKELQNELLSLQTNSYTEGGKGRINSSVQTILDRINGINTK
jgi:hypothetical protein